MSVLFWGLFLTALWWTELCFPKIHRLKPWPQIWLNLEIWIIRVKWGHKGGVLSNRTGILIRRGRHTTLSLSMLTPRKGHSEKIAFYKPGREASPDINPGGTLILDFWPPELWENTLLLFTIPTLRRFVMAAPVDWHRLLACTLIQLTLEQHGG